MCTGCVIPLHGGCIINLFVDARVKQINKMEISSTIAILCSILLALVVVAGLFFSIHPIVHLLKTFAIAAGKTP